MTSIKYKSTTKPFSTLNDYEYLIEMRKNKCPDNLTYLKNNDDYFCIKYNNYIITNPYFLSLYSAFKIVLDSKLKYAKQNKEYYIEWINDSKNKGDLSYIEYEKKLNEINKRISTLEKYTFNLEYETKSNINSIVDSSITFNINDNIYEYKEYFFGEDTFYSINTYSNFNNDTGFYKTISYITDRLHRTYGHKEFSRNAIRLQINQFKDVNDNWKYNEKSNVQGSKKVINFNKNKNKKFKFETETKSETFKHYDFHIIYPDSHFEFNVYNSKLIQIIDFLEIITDFHYHYENKKYTIPDIIKTMLYNIFVVGHSGTCETDFINDIYKFSDEELIIMLAALLNI